ncbi:MAG: RRXRR domain-containing protein [Desulfovibrionaceae bacterium]|nr:RRXRR domain-containing protein [Desulfovibrionaceae bacterium]
MQPVFVISQNGTKLMPTPRFRHVRHLLKDNLAKIVTYHLFTIQLPMKVQNMCKI